MNTPYDIDFYRLIREGSERSAAIVVPLVMRMISPASVVDVGCGTGAWLSEFERAGVTEILGLEFSEITAEVMHIERSKVLLVDASKPFELNRKFDLAVSLEVAEHLPEQSASTFVQSITRLAPIVIFSAAVPNQGGVNHINEQWPSYWAAHFAQHGFVVSDSLRDKIWLDSRVEWWYRQNLLFFVRSDVAHQYPEIFAGTNADVALDRVLPKKMRLAATAGPRTSPTISAVVLTKNGSTRGLDRCLNSIVESKFCDELVVCIDQSTIDESAQIARKYTNLVHFVETPGYVEDVLPEMMSRCSGDFILRLDDDECLAGDWDRRCVEALVKGNDTTHFFIPRCWLVPPGDRFISSPPWWPNLALRLFKNDASLITWPDRIHDQMGLGGTGLVLSDRWIVHYDLLISSRPERERKCQHYRNLRPELHLSNFYLYEDEEFEIAPTTREVILDQMDILKSQPEYKKVSPVPYYQLNTDIRFDGAGNSTDYAIDGWSAPEDWGRWTSGTRALLRLRLKEPITVAARLVADVGAFIRPKHPTMRVFVTCQDQFLGEWSFTSPERAECAVTLPMSLLQGRKDLNFAFFIIDPMSPAQCGESDDERPLGLGFRTMKIQPELDTLALDRSRELVHRRSEAAQDQNAHSMLPQGHVTDQVPNPSEAQVVAELDQQIAALQTLVAQKDAVISNILESTSWRLSKPIRTLGRFLKKLRK